MADAFAKLTIRKWRDACATIRLGVVAILLFCPILPTIQYSILQFGPSKTCTAICRTWAVVYAALGPERTAVAIDWLDVEETIRTRVELLVVIFGGGQ